MAHKSKLFLPDGDRNKMKDWNFGRKQSDVTLNTNIII